MKNDALLYFNSPREYLEYFKKLGIFHGWELQQGLLNNRGKFIRDKRYAQRLMNDFDSRDFFYKKVSCAETVSWLDNLELLRRFCILLDKKLDIHIYTKIQIYFEYMIKKSKRMRIDVVFEYEGKLLLLEFRMVDNFEKIKRTWDKKIQETLVYKELMSYYVTNLSNIYVFSLISLYEIYMGKPVKKHIAYNEKQLEFLAEYMISYLIE